MLIGWRLSIEHLFLFLAVPLTIGLVASVVLAILYYRKFQVLGLAGT